MWFDEFELGDLADTGAKEIADALDTGDAKKGREMNKVDRIVCPKCKALMIRMVHVEQPHVWYEHCTVCGGSVLDAGEFKDLTRETFADFFKGLFTPERDYD